jgi:serine/threonine protein kinase
VPVSTDPRIGTELLGYRIEALVGRGGMGVVYRAYEPRLKRNVALKLIAPELSEDAHFRERFLVETELAASLEHPNVVPIHDAGEVDGQLYLVMRYVEGGELKTLLQKEGPLEPGRALAVCGQVGAALDAAHARGLVHRDVKPSNVLLDEHEHAYLTDFGLSRRLADAGTPGDDRHSVGTPAYASPEQIRGGEVDGRADVYALGCLVYECLTGQPPFSRASELALLWAHLQEPQPKPSERNPDVASGIDAVVATAMAKSPDDRYSSCRELIEASRDALGLHPHAVRDRRALVLVAAGVAIVAAAVIAGVLLTRGSDQPGRPNTKPTLTPKVDSLQRIDARTNKLVATIGGVGSNPSAIATGAGSVWVGSQDDGTVARVDPQTNAVRASVNTGAPKAMVVRDGSVLVANTFDTLTSIAPATLAVTASDNPGYGAFALGGDALWALVDAPSGGGRLDRINHGGQIVKTIFNLGPYPVALAAGRQAAWVLDDISRSLLRVDPVTNSVVRRLRLGFEPGRVAVGDGSVWVTDPAGRGVVRIDPGAMRIAGRIPVGRDPVAVVVGHGSVWVANYESGTVARIDPRKGSLVATIPVGPHPATLTTGAGGVWVAVRAS